MVEAQRRLIKMDQHETKTITKSRRINLDKAIKIPDLECFMWTEMKQNFDKDIK
jgi:hypothetical protein